MILLESSAQIPPRPGQQLHKVKQSGQPDLENQTKPHFKNKRKRNYDRKKLQLPRYPLLTHVLSLTVSPDIHCQYEKQFPANRGTNQDFSMLHNALQWLSMFFSF